MLVTENIADAMAPAADREPIRVLIDADRCAGCQECAVRCPTGALSLNSDRWQVEADSSLCVACRQCERTCPFHAIEVYGPALSGRPLELPSQPPRALSLATWETHAGIPTLRQARAEAERCLDCPDPTCALGCPAHNDIPRFVRALAAGDVEGARDILAETSAFPEICSRVCDQSTQCEGACSWTLAGSRPVAIGLLERFVADHAAPRRPNVPAVCASGLSVAVVGAGPAGIAAALGLRQSGADVVVYERRTRPLGVLDWGIPAFTLPDAVAQGPLRRLEEAGVAVRLGIDVAAGDDLDRLRANHDAVVLAVGASLPLPSPVNAAPFPWVEDSSAFLVRAKDALRRGRHLDEIVAGTRLLVLGAGNTAMDVARSAVRLGAGSVVCVDWMDERFARVRPDELEQARVEGVAIRFKTSLAALRLEDGDAHAAYLAHTEQRSAARRPRVLAGPPERMVVDRVVVATGYRVEPDLARALSATFPTRAPRLRGEIPDRSWMASGLTQAPGPVPLMAREREWFLRGVSAPVADGVWVAGDAHSGPATVVAAMAQGLAVARAVTAARPSRVTRTATPLAVTPLVVVARQAAAPVVATESAVAEAGASGTLVAGLALVGYGILSSLTIVGLPLGVPMIVIGLILVLADLVIGAVTRGPHRVARRARLTPGRPSRALHR